MIQYIRTLLISLLLFSCSNSPVAGGSTTVENPFVVCSVQGSDSAFVTGAEIALYPSNYNPLTEESSRVYFSTSDETGIAHFEPIPVGTYTAVVQADSLATLIYPVTIGAETSDTIFSTVKPLVTARVHTDTEADQVYFKGTPYVAEMSGENSFIFKAVPEGLYPDMIIQSDSASSRLDNITLEPGETVDIFEENRNLTLTSYGPLNDNYANSTFISVATVTGMEWFGTEQSGMWSFPQNESPTHTFGDTSSLFSKSIVEIATGAPWSASENPENLLLRTKSGTMHYHNGTGILLESLLLPTQDETSSNAVHMDSSGRGWVAFDTVVCYMSSQDEWTERVQLNHVVSIAGDYDARLFLGQRNGTITVLNSDTSYTITLPESNLTIYSMAVTPNGTLFVGTDRGIYQHENDDRFSLVVQTTAPITKMVTDSHNDLYALFGTNSIFRLSDSFTYTGIGGMTIYDIAPKETGVLSLAAGDAGAFSCQFQ